MGEGVTDFEIGDDVYGIVDMTLSGSNAEYGLARAEALARKHYPEIRRRFDGLYMANNGFDKARANRAIAEDKVDLIAFGKSFISNPDLVTRFLLDAPLSELNRDTLYGGNRQGYTDYPVLDAVAPGSVPCWG